MVKIDLSVVGELQRADGGPSGWLVRVESLARARYGHMLTGVLHVASADEPALLLRFHPAAPGLQLSVTGGDVLRVHASADTERVGPGYHDFLCRFLREVEAELDLRWTDARDDSGYWSSGDFSALTNHFDAVWSALATALLQQPATQAPLDLVGLGWLRFSGPEFVFTARGPRDRIWLEQVAAGASARDALVWWEAGFGADYALGRVDSLLWLEARLRPPFDQGEHATLAEIDRLLSELYTEDPSVPLPAAWTAVRVLLDEPPIPELPFAPPGQLGGYWSRPVEIHLPGWHVTLPANAAVEWTAPGTVSVRTALGAIWLSALSGAEADPLDDLEPDPALSRDEPGLWARAAIVPAMDRDDETGDEIHYQALVGVCRAGGHLLVATLCFDDAAGRAMVESVWRSAHPAAPDAESERR